MKRVLLLALVVGFFAGQASAAIYELDAGVAAQLDTFTLTGGAGGLFSGPWIGAYSTTPPAMTGAVGWQGTILNTTSPGQVLIHASAPGVITGITDGSYTDYQAYIYNDDADTWDVRLAVNPAGIIDPDIYGAWTPLLGGQSALVSLGSGFTWASSDSDIGFEVRTGAGNTGDAFHVSAVPLPGAVLLGFLGLGVAGIKLRRFA